METVTLWDEDMKEVLVKVSELQLDMFLSLLNYISDNNISNKLSYDFYDNPDLWQWLSSKEQIGRKVWRCK